MHELIESIDAENKVMAETFEEEHQSVVYRPENAEPPKDALMIDGVTRRALSPQSVELFTLIDTWPEAFDGKTIVPPDRQDIVMSLQEVQEELRLIKVNFIPYAPTLSGDDARTMLFAYEPLEHWLTFLWWETEDSPEPRVIDYDGGGVRAFESIKDFLTALAQGDTVTDAGTAVEERMRDRAV